MKHVKYFGLGSLALGLGGALAAGVVWLGEHVLYANKIFLVLLFSGIAYVIGRAILMDVSKELQDKKVAPKDKKRRWFSSELVAAAYEEVGAPLNQENSTRPGDLLVKRACIVRHPPGFADLLKVYFQETPMEPGARAETVQATIVHTPAQLFEDVHNWCEHGKLPTEQPVQNS